MHWIESQSSPIIAVVVFTCTYLVTATIFCVAVVLSRTKAAKDLKSVTPATLTPLGVILGLLIAFLAARVWTNVDRAGEYVGQEADALRETVLLSDFLPPDARTKVRMSLERHIESIQSKEWPAMADGQAPLRPIPTHLVEAMAALLSFVPTQTNQQLAQNRALVAIEKALETRRHRLRLSRSEIAPIQWAVVIVPALMILLTIAMVHIETRLAMAVTLFAFSSAVAISLALLMVYDRPFGSGGSSISPTLLREVFPD
jgi:hypothetical protein